MTDNFKKMLEYQKLDMELRKINKEFNSLPAKKKLDVTRNKFNEAQSDLDHNAANAATYGSEVERLHAEFGEIMKRFEAVEAQYSAATTAEEKAALLPKLEQIRSNAESCKNKLNNRIDKIKMLTNECMQNLATKKKVKEEFDKIKTSLDEIRAKSMPERKRIEEQMKSIETTLDQALLSAYNKFRSDGIAPVFVPVVGDNEKDYACACGMQLSQTNKSELKNKSMCQCDTCRRMVYLA